MNWLAIFIGGGIGSLLRFSIGKINFTTNFPLNTFIANVLACTLLAIMVYFFKPSHQLWNLLIITGVCGGLSTFSTFSYETFQLFETGNYWVALANIFVSILTCLLVFMLLKNAI